jgi:hypothetical protein
MAETNHQELLKVMRGYYVNCCMLYHFNHEKSIVGGDCVSAGVLSRSED